MSFHVHSILKNETDKYECGKEQKENDLIFYK